MNYTQIKVDYNDFNSVLKGVEKLVQEKTNITKILFYDEVFGEYRFRPDGVEGNWNVSHYVGGKTTVSFYGVEITL